MGMRLTIHLVAQRLIAHSHFRLVVKQMNGEFEATNSIIVAYLQKDQHEIAK